MFHGVVESGEEISQSCQTRGDGGMVRTRGGRGLEELAQQQHEARHVLDGSFSDLECFVGI